MVGYCDLHLEQQKKKPKKSNTHAPNIPSKKNKKLGLFITCYKTSLIKHNLYCFLCSLKLGMTNQGYGDHSRAQRQGDFIIIILSIEQNLIMVCLLVLHSTPSYGLPNYSALLAAPFYSGSSLFSLAKFRQKTTLKFQNSRIMRFFRFAIPRR